MSAFAALMTGRGSGAIATIQLVGDSVEAVLRKSIRRAGNKSLEWMTGRIVLGRVVDGDEVVDQVTVGCESPGVLAIHCHGNPLIVERIMGLLQRNGARLLTAEEMLAKVLAAQPCSNAIAAEAKLALTTVKTIAGAKILAHQIESGLSARVRQWQEELDDVPLSQVAAEAEQILRDSETARLLVRGCTIALIGPPNTGKSTLLNTLAGREKAIVTDIRGTTRDWISAEIQIPPLAVTIIDTAGLDSSLTADNRIDQAAQHRSNEIIGYADLVLLILDASQPADELSEPFLKVLRDKRTILVLNKADLPGHFDCTPLPPYLGPPVRISARQVTGIETLIQAIHQALNTARVDSMAAVAFTARQGSLLEQLSLARSGAEARRIIAQFTEERLVTGVVA